MESIHSHLQLIHEQRFTLFINETARKVIVSKFKFFILKLWEFARLFAAMACVNLVFPSQKLNSNGTLQRDTRGFNAAFSQ